MSFIKTLLAFALALLTATAFAAIDVNKASQPELESIKGIGPGLSGRILEARKTGAFSDWNDLSSRVKGVRGGNASKFSAEGLTVNGKAYVAESAAPAKANAAKKDPAATSPAFKAKAVATPASK